MRVTNQMMSNRMMLNINRNMGNLDTLYTQYSTGKKIQFPSDNPIIASRALKFRTTVAENLQYQKNAAQGLSWMEVTEQGYKECIDVLSTIRDLVIQGDGVESTTDKQKLATQIQSYAQQLGLAMNKSYTGRYLFSGYRTDEPGTILKDSQTLKYTDITQNFSKSDIESITAYQKLTDTSVPVLTDASVLKLAYKNAEDVKLTATAADGTDTVVTVTSISKNHPDAYKPPADEAYYIEETGELVLGENVAKAAEFKVTYDKEGFLKGELNPKAYFTCTDSDGTVFTTDNQNINYEFGIGTSFPVNSLADDVFSSSLYADLMNFCDFVLGAKISDKAKLIDDLKAKPENADLSADEIEKLASEQLTLEEERLETALQKKFSNMIGIIDNHVSDLSKSHTDLGSRMSRLELIQKRLEEDETAYTKLLSENEDADLIEVAMLLSNAEGTYQASLQAGMKIIQLTLANFL